jgi:serine/threonine protein kinase
MSERVEWKTEGKGGKCERADCIMVNYLKPIGNTGFDDFLFFLYDNDDPTSKDATLKGILMGRMTQAPGFKKGTMIGTELTCSEPINIFILHAKKSEIQRAKVHIQSRPGQAVSKTTAMEFFLSSGRQISLITEYETFGELALILHWNDIKVEAKDPSFKLRFLKPVSQSDLPGLDRVNLLISKKSKYLVARTVARGGFGKLHLALDTKSKKMLAVKVFSAYKKTVSRTSEKDLNSELKLQREFQPKIKIYDQFKISSDGKYQGSPLTKFYVMMDIFACSLKKIIGMLPSEQKVFNPQERKTRWTPARLTAKEIFDLKHYIFAEVAEDVQRLHAKNYRHGDIKDANVLVSYDGDVALSDYGSAQKDPKRTLGTDGWYPGGESGRGFKGDIGALFMLFLRIHCLLEVKPFSTSPPLPSTIGIFSDFDGLLEKQKKELHLKRIDTFAKQMKGMLSSGRKTIITSDSSASVKSGKRVIATLKATLEGYDSMRKTTTIYPSLVKKGISVAYKAAHEDLARYLSGREIYRENVKIGEMIKLVKAVRQHINVIKSKKNLEILLTKSDATNLQKYRKALADAGRLIKGHF